MRRIADAGIGRPHRNHNDQLRGELSICPPVFRFGNSHRSLYQNTVAADNPDVLASAVADARCSDERASVRAIQKVAFPGPTDVEEAGSGP